MKDVLKIALKSFFPTLIYVGIGWLLGIVLSKVLIWVYDSFGALAASFGFFGALFLVIWIGRAYTDYRISKIDKEYEEKSKELVERLKNIK